MLDIRTTTYISPLSEVPFKSVPLTVHIVNVADETGLVTGKFRVYNVTTGLLIHTSDIAPLTLTAGTSTDASALTNFDPPAPADDTYFVLFDGIASNALVPDGITLQLGVFYFDVKPVGMGPAPAAHHVTHEDTGSDEINVTGLSGVLADDQPPKHHAPTHQAAGDDVVDHNLVHFSKLHPSADSTSALQILKADAATPIATIDSTNSRLGIGTTSPGSGLSYDSKLHIEGSGSGSAGRTAFLVKNLTANSAAIFSLLNSASQSISCQVSGPSYLIGAHGAIFTESALDLQFTTDGNLSTGGSAPITFKAGGYACANTVYIAAGNPGKVGIATDSPTATLDVNSNIIRLRTAKTPASAGGAGNAGDICWDADYIYVCVATNTWKRAAIATW